MLLNISFRVWQKIIAKDNHDTFTWIWMRVKKKLQITWFECMIKKTEKLLCVWIKKCAIERDSERAYTGSLIKMHCTVTTSTECSRDTDIMNAYIWFFESARHYYGQLSLSSTRLWLGKRFPKAWSVFSSAQKKLLNDITSRHKRKQLVNNSNRE